jgi:hypothetical protein
MGDARYKGGPGRGRAGPSGEHRLRPHKAANDRWLERLIRGLYQSAVDEPVPNDMLDPVRRIGGSDASTTQASDRARRWWAKAEECRTAADSMSTEAARSSFLQRARNCKALAEHAEREAHHRSDKNRNAG